MGPTYIPNVSQQKQIFINDYKAIQIWVSYNKKSHVRSQGEFRQTIEVSIPLKGHKAIWALVLHNKAFDSRVLVQLQVSNAFHARPQSEYTSGQPTEC